MRAVRRLLGRVPPLAWGIGAALVLLPFYLAFFARVLQRFGGVEFWIPRG